VQSAGVEGAYVHDRRAKILAASTFELDRNGAVAEHHLET
jgi:hypothetical protein